MSDTSTHHLKGRAAFTVFGCFAFAYLLSYFVRAVSAVIAPDLSQEFSLSHGQLGWLTSLYFLAFASMQLPLGVLLDRWGSRRVHGALLLIAATGCLVFSAAQGPAMLWLGRILLGLGVAGALMAAMKAFRFWYPGHLQASLGAWVLMTGSLGGLLATIPARQLVDAWGWRALFVLSAAGFVVASLLLLWRLPRDEEQSSAAAAAASNQSLWAGYLQVFRSRYFWRIAQVALLCSAFVSSMNTLWAGPWLIHVNGMSPGAAAQVLFAINLVMLLGYLTVGAVHPWLVRRGWSTVRLIILVSLVMMGCELILASTRAPVIWPVWLVLTGAATFFAVVQPLVSLGFPPALTGRAYTAYNLFIFGGNFLWQWLFGVLVDTLHGWGLSEAQGFQGAMLMAVALQIVSLLILAFWRVAPQGEVIR